MDGDGLRAGSALAPLHAAEDARAALRAAGAEPEQLGDAIFHLAEAVEACLRRILRDDPTVPMPLRLQALAADELSTDQLLDELRRRDRISLEFAAAFHEMVSVRVRAQAGSPPAPGEVGLALRVAEYLEREAVTPPPSRFPSHEERDPVEEETLVHPVPPSRPGMSRSWLGATVAVLTLLVVAVALLIWRERRADAELQAGIALYRDGRSPEAVEHLRRYADDHPDDPTPRLFLARIHRRAGRLDQARNELRRAVDVSPRDPALHRELGLLLMDAGRPGEAVARFRTALQMDEESSEAWLGLIRALRSAGYADAAARALLLAPPEVRTLIGSADTPPLPALP